MRLLFALMLLAVATASAVTFRQGRKRCILRAKFACWERHRAEYAARIVLFYGNTLLFGDAVLGCLNEILCGAHNANNREDAQRYGQITFSASSLTAVIKAKRCFKARLNRLGKIALAAATAAVALADTFYNARTEKDGRDDLNDCGGFILLITFFRRASAEVFTHSVAFEYADIALATIKDNAFFEYGNTLNFLRASGANTSFKYDFYVKTNVDRVKSAVETDWVDIDTRPNNFCTLCANCAGAFQYFITKIRKINACIFKAIAVAAGIEDAICVNAYGLACRSTAGHARKFIFCHSQISL